MRVLIWDLPINFLTDGFFNLAVADQSALLMAIEDDPEALARDFFPGQVIKMADDVAQRGNLRNSHHVKLIAVANHFKILVAQPWSHVHQNEVIAHAQKLESLRDRAGKDASRRIVALWGGNQIETTGVMGEEALQQFRIKPVIVLDKFKEVIA